MLDKPERLASYTNCIRPLPQGEGGVREERLANHRKRAIGT
jgi:hypothetical protein